MSTYYVATIGNDSTGDGSIGTPWRTIQKGCDSLIEGDTLYIRGGTYQETATMRRSGSSGNVITIKAYTGETVIIDGAYTRPAGAGPGYLFYNNPYNQKISGDTWRYTVTGAINYECTFGKLLMVDANYVSVEDIRFIRSRGHATGSSVAVNNVTIKNCEMWDIRHSAIHFYAGSDSITIDGCDVRRACNFAQFQRPGGHINWPGTIQLPGTTNCTIKNTSVHDVWGEGCNMSMSGGLVEDCIFSNTYSVAIYAQKTHDYIVRRNLVYMDESSVLGLLPRGRSGISVTLEPWNTPNPGRSVTGVRIENNIVIGWPNNINIGANAGTTGTWLVDDVEIVNNTMVNPRSTIGSYTPYNFGFSSTAATITNIKFRNNLLYLGTGAGSNAVNVKNSNPGAGFTASNNLYHGGAAPAWAQGTGDVTNGSGLSRPDATVVYRPVASEAYEPGAIANNYYIGDSGSSAIDAGTATDAPSDDYAGSTRTGTIDIGAHEYGATSIPSGVTADFSASATSGTGQLTVQFFDDSSGTPTGWNWQYKEENDSAYTWFSGVENPVRTFSPGTYSISLTVSDASTSDTKIRASYIVVAASTGDSGAGTPGGGSGVSISTSGAGSTQTSTGDQLITLNSALTPTAAVFLWCGATANGSATDEAAIGVGFTDGTNDYALGAAAKHNQATIQNDVITRTDGVIGMITPGTLSQRAKASHVDFSAGGMTLNWSQAYSTAAFRMGVLGIVATNAAAGVCTPASSIGSTVNISPGFTPDALILVHTGTNSPGTADDYRSALGFAVNGGSQIAAAWRYDDDDAAQENGARIASTRGGMASSNTGANQTAVEVTSWGSTTVLTTRDTANTFGNEVHWLALELENGVYCGIIDTPTSTGNQAYTGVGFRPGALLLIGTMIDTVDSAVTDADAGSIGYGIWCSDGGEYCFTAQAENGAATSNTQSYANTKIMDLPIDDGGAGITATMVSADADGFTLNFSATLGTARKWLVFALEDGSVFRPDFVKVGTTPGMFAGLP